MLFWTGIFEILAKTMGMDTFKNEKVWYGISTNEMIQYFNGTFNGIVVHYYLINSVVNSHV